MSTPHERRQHELVLDLVLGRIAEDEFCHRFPCDRAAAGAEGLRMLSRAISHRDAVGVEMGLFMGFRFGFSSEHLPVLHQLALEPWHQRHEDVVSALDELRSPESVDVLHRAALSRHAYLEYDEAFALGRNAVHALAKIGSEDAVERLRRLAHCGNSPIEESARAQLERRRE